jgi:predicted AAA+ superfamily ATPase
MNWNAVRPERSDRFGLWLGFHKCSQDEYLAMIRAYVERYALDVEPDSTISRASRWRRFEVA